MRELGLARFYAEEGLSLGRTANLIGRTRASLAGAAKRHGIVFAGEVGAPFGNANRRGKYARGRTGDQVVADRRKSSRQSTRLYRQRQGMEAQLSGD